MATLSSVLNSLLQGSQGQPMASVSSRPINVSNYPTLVGLLGSAPRAIEVQPSTSQEMRHQQETGAGTSSSYSASPPRRHMVNLTGELFPAAIEASKQGKRHTLRYRIPGQPLCYTFDHMRTTTTGNEVYRCTGCRKNGKTISIAARDGSNLVGDPVQLPHICIPWKYEQDVVTRAVYKKCQEIPKDSRYAFVRPRQIYQSLAEEIDYSEGAGEAEREDRLHYFCRNGYDSRRYAIRRALSKLHGSRVTMDSVPENFALLPDGATFLQYRTAEIHIYYSNAIIEKACRIGLYGLVGDGVHDLQPDATNANGQLYTIHGVMANSVDVPLLFAITTRKNERVYERIFGKLKEAIEAAGGRNNIRILLDYEKAAINAAKRCFPSASVEGCAFHLAQAWNRRRDALGLRQQGYVVQMGCLDPADHKRGGVVQQVKYPRMSDLLRALQGTVTTAPGTLLNIERRRMDPRPLRRRDRIRRRRVEREMARFKELLSRTRGFPSTRTITTYCRRMARFVTEKVV